MRLATRMQKTLFGSALTTLLMLSGCATLSEDECRSADWRAIGFGDGVNGYPASRINQHRKACAKHGVSPQPLQYEEGRQQGLRDYCQEPRGFQVGLGGQSYQNVCPAALEGQFLAGYQKGREIYLTEREASSLGSQINSKQKQLDTLREKLDKSQSVDEVRDMAREEGALEAEIKELTKQKYETEARVKALRDMYGAY